VLVTIYAFLFYDVMSFAPIFFFGTLVPADIVGLLVPAKKTFALIVFVSLKLMELIVVGYTANVVYLLYVPLYSGSSSYISAVFVELLVLALFQFGGIVFSSYIYQDLTNAAAVVAPAYYASLPGHSTMIPMNSIPTTIDAGNTIPQGHLLPFGNNGYAPLAKNNY